MRVAVISFILACLAGLEAFFMIERGEAPKKTAEVPDSQPSTGLVPVTPPIQQEVAKAPENQAKPAEKPAQEAPAPQSAAPVPAVSAAQLKGLAQPPVDPSTPDEVVMASHPALIMKGQAKWDDGYAALAKAFALLREQAKRLALTETGYPVTVFVETDDQGFKYEAELPVSTLPSQRPADLPADLRFGATPEGKAVRFVHRGAYDEIDSTYEAISAYVDVKGLEVKDTLIEEYISMGNDSSDLAIEVHIYVQPVK